MSRLPIHQQPKVSSAYRLLTSYLHEGLLLDLYGEFDADGYTVLDVALTGTNVGLFPLVTLEFLDQLSTWCNAKLPSAAELRRASEREGRAERAIWQRQAA